VVAHARVYVCVGPPLTILGIGGAPNHPFAPLPGLASPAPAGQRDAFGWVSKISGNVITLTTRNSSSLQIDTANAIDQAEDTEIGAARDVWGKDNAQGVLVTTPTLRAKEPSSLWPPDP
jgi:hypothetical protein